MDLLQQFVQISDLHFANVDPMTGKPRYPKAARFWPYAPFLSGYWGHSDPALAALERFWEDVREDDDQARLIVTGDLTSIADGGQFDDVQQFLNHELRPTHATEVGLREPAWRYFGIPGNHDHWNGHYCPFDGPTPALDRCFGHTSTWPNRVILRLRNGWAIDFLKLNTDIDIDARSPDRLFARGEFVTHLRGLEASLAARPPRPGEVRVMLLHHSLDHAGAFLELNDHSRVELRRFLHRHDVKILLSGHTHQPKLSHTAVQHPDTLASLDVFESCCGTTTQDDDPPFGLRTQFGIPVRKRFPQNALVRHAVHDAGRGVLRWTAEVYRRVGPFQPSNHPAERSYVEVRV